MKKKTKKIIPLQRHHIHLDVALRSKGLHVVVVACEDANIVVVACIFNRAVMGKTIPLSSLAVAGEEEEINLQN